MKKLKQKPKASSKATDAAAVRRKLFDLYSQNLALYAPTLAGQYLCPLCMRAFDDASPDDGSLTLEHVVPRAVGGTFPVLTCKECNNTSGHEIDSHLKRETEFEDFLAGVKRTPTPVLASVPGVDARVPLEFLQLDTDPPTADIVAFPKASNPDALEALAKHLSVRGERSVELRVRGDASPIRVNASLTKSAYLLAFRTFGYGYIAHRNLDHVREFIRAPKSSAKLMPPVVGLTADTEARVLNQVSLLHTPPDLRCFFPIVDASTELTRVYGVVLPGFDEDVEGLYARWRKLAPPGTLITDARMKFSPVPFDARLLVGEQNRQLPQMFWRDHRREPTQAE